VLCMTVLKKLMKSKNLTIHDLAEQACVNARTLERYVSGNKALKDASYAFVVSIARTLDVDPDVLIE